MEHEKETAWFKNSLTGMNLRHKIYVRYRYNRLHMQLSFIALYVNAESVFKSCLTLRGLGDNSLRLVESPL